MVDAFMFTVTVAAVSLTIIGVASIAMHIPESVTDKVVNWFEKL